MDFSAFAADDFDVLEWVNAAVEHAGAGAATSSPSSPTTAAAASPRADHDAQLSTQVMKLQLLSQDLNSSIAYSMKQLLELLPAATRGLNQMQETLTALDSSVQGLGSVLDDANSRFEGDRASSSILQLEQLDTVKKNMTRCSDRLREAANWKRQLREAQRALIHPAGSVTSSTLVQVSSLIESLDRSRGVLHDMPGSAGRDDTFAQLRTKFKALLDTQLDGVLKAYAAGSSKPEAAKTSGNPAATTAAAGVVGGAPTATTAQAAARDPSDELRSFVEIYVKLGWTTNLHEQYASVICSSKVDDVWKKHSNSFSHHLQPAHSQLSSSTTTSRQRDLLSARQRASSDRRALGTFLRGVLVALRHECDEAARRFFTSVDSSASAALAMIQCSARLVAKRLSQLVDPVSSTNAGPARGPRQGAGTFSSPGVSSGDEHYEQEVFRGFFEETSVFATGLLRRAADSCGRRSQMPSKPHNSIDAVQRKLLNILSEPFGVDGRAVAVQEIRCIEQQVAELGLQSLLQSGAVAGGNKTVYLEAVNRVEHCSAVLFRDVDLSCTRFFAVTRGVGAHEFVASADKTVSAYLEVLEALLRQMRAAAGVDKARGAAFASKAATQQKAQLEAKKAENRKRAAEAQENAMSVDDLFSANDDPDDVYGADEDGIDQALFGAFSDWSFLQGANQLLHHCNSMLGRVASADKSLSQAIADQKSIFFGSPSMLLLDGLRSSSTTATSANEVTLSPDSSHLLAQYVALATLEASPKQRESLQILWQTSHVNESSSSVVDADRADNKPAKLLLKSVSAVRELLRGLRVLQFDIMCLAVDECVKDIAKHILAEDLGGGDELSSRYSCGVSSETRKLEEYTVSLVEQFSSLFCGDDSDVMSSATLDSIWAAAERRWELLALRLSVAHDFPSLKTQIRAAAVSARAASRTSSSHAKDRTALLHDPEFGNSTRDHIWLPTVAHYIMSSFLAEVLQAQPGGLSDRARLQVVADMSYLDAHLCTRMNSVQHPAWVEALACFSLASRDELDARVADLAATKPATEDEKPDLVARLHIARAILLLRE